jgi:DNA ligase-1
MQGVKRLEPKLDGVRVLMVCNIEDSGDAVSVVAYSRNGKVFDNFGHIESQISASMPRLAARTGYSAFVLDGEIIGSSFQALMRQARRKENINASDSNFHIFDFIPLADFTRGFWEVPLKQRLAELNKIRPLIEEMPNVSLLPHIEVNLDSALGREQFDRYATDSVSQGFEGIMIKSLTSPYECKRNTFWLKWKPTVSVDLEVIDVEEGTGRNVGRLGALVCMGTDNGKTISVNVGSGFSDSDQSSVWFR